MKEIAQTTDRNHCPNYGSWPWHRPPPAAALPPSRCPLVATQPPPILRRAADTQPQRCHRPAAALLMASRRVADAQPPSCRDADRCQAVDAQPPIFRRTYRRRRLRRSSTPTSHLRVSNENVSLILIYFWRMYWYKQCSCTNRKDMCILIQFRTLYWLCFAGRNTK
jgi:hypothetical protein